jgi:exodeoxyribonuclease VII small subunit
LRRHLLLRGGVGIVMIPVLTDDIGITVAKSKIENLDFEAAMAELESLVERMEAGDLPLEETLKQFERGVTLTRQCQSALKEAEQKVQILSGSGENAEPEDFASSEE